MEKQQEKMMMMMKVGVVHYSQEHRQEGLAVVVN
jgi:hypothetical protein